MERGLQDWASKNAGRFTGTLLLNEPLSKHTYYRIGGPASVLVAPKTAEDVSWVREALRVSGAPFFILGAGSNILVSDRGFPGLVIKTGRLNLEITKLAENRIRTGGSVAVSTLLRRCAQEGWAGLELLTGVPGSIGGVIRMNAGTHLGEARDRIVKVEALSLSNDGSLSYEPQSFRFEYRKNLFLPADALVFAAEWRIESVEPAMVKAALDDLLARRKATQPVDYPSCGSVFKNPRAHGLSAWQVVDKLGLRGHRIGDAQFAEKHSNFIINLGAARAEDVRGLIELAKKRAQAELGVELEPEVIFVGTP